GERRAEAEMVLALSNLEFFLGGKEPADVLERFRRNDQVTRRRRRHLHRNIHLCKAVAVRRNHAHVLGPQFPEHAIENWTAFFCRRSECGMRNELLQVARRNSQRFLELHRGETRELTLWQSEELELRASALERDSLITGCGDLYRCGRELARN